MNYFTQQKVGSLWFLIIFICTSIFSSVVISGDLPKQKTLEYTFLTTGNPSGSQAVSINQYGDRMIKFEFNDRGRGPKIDSLVKFENGIIPISFSAKGMNYRKGQINENFTTKNGISKWSSSIQKGELKSDDTRFYLSVNETPEYRAILARALLHAPKKELPLIPNGHAKIHFVESLHIANKSNKQNVKLFSITGLGLTPVYVWLDDDKELFGYDDGWYAIVRKGWESEHQKIKQAQSTALEIHSTHQMNELAHKIDNNLTITEVNVLNVLKGTFSGPMDVTIANGHITKIRQSKPSNPVMKGKQHNGKGKFLIPALWDMHAHMYRERYLNYVSGGVLNVRDMANDPDYLDKVMLQIKEGRLAGPDIHPVGFIDKKGEFSAPTGRLASSLKEALSFVDEYAARGYHGIKLYSSIEPSWIKPISERAKKYDLKVMGHIPSFMSATEAINDGYDEVTHINMILLQLLNDKSIDTRTPSRFIVPGKKGGTIDLNSSDTKEFITLLKSKNIAHDPTLGTFVETFRNRVGEMKIISRNYADHLPPSLKRNEIGKKSYNYGYEKEFDKTAQKSLEIIKILFDNSITILPGTDYQLPGFSLISELETYHEAGIPNEAILQIATINSAKYLNMDKILGSVDVGKKAHLVLLEDNPIKNISALRKAEMVIKDNYYFYPYEIFIAQGVVPFTEKKEP